MRNNVRLADASFNSKSRGQYASHLSKSENHAVGDIHSYHNMKQHVVLCVYGSSYAFEIFYMPSKCYFPFHPL